jgi:hypothetical protein
LIHVAVARRVVHRCQRVQMLGSELGAGPRADALSRDFPHGFPEALTVNVAHRSGGLHWNREGCFPVGLARHRGMDGDTRPEQYCRLAAPLLDLQAL